MSIKSSYEIGGKRIEVFDGLISLEHVRKLESALRQGSYRRNEIATPESRHVTHHSVELTKQDAQNLGLYGPSYQALMTMTNSRQYAIHRIYCNACYYGDLLLPHVDAEPNNGDITALWYLNAQWDRQWGGETLFYDDENNTAIAIQSIPGRLVLFDGEITHVGKAPNRNCFEPRFTLAFKFYPHPG